MGLGANSKDVASDNSNAEFKLPTDLVYFKMKGGMHISVLWMDVFTYGLPLMYGVNFPEPYRAQRNSNMDVIYPENYSTSSCDESSISDSAMVGLIIYVIVSSLLILMLCSFILYTWKSNAYYASSEKASLSSARATSDQI